LSNRYNEKLAGLPITLPYQLTNTHSGLHLYVIRLNLNELKKTHKEVFEALRENGIGVNLHYIPVHMHPYYQKMGFKVGDYPNAESYYKEAISIPIFHSMTVNQQDVVIEKLKSILL
jgi:dTDP-4-amino-4,6-dideoxygalactose transaminase